MQLGSSDGIAHSLILFFVISNFDWNILVLPHFRRRKDLFLLISKRKRLIIHAAVYQEWRKIRVKNWWKRVGHKLAQKMLTNMSIIVFYFILMIYLFCLFFVCERMGKLGTLINFCGAYKWPSSTVFVSNYAFLRFATVLYGLTRCFCYNP